MRRLDPQMLALHEVLQSLSYLEQVMVGASARLWNLVLDYPDGHNNR